jgi:site-specific recombinase XerD
MKLSEAAAQYLDTGGNLRTEASRTRLSATVRQLADYCGDRAMASYTIEELTGFCLGHGGRGTAPASINTRASVLRPFFEWCTWQKIITRNPATELKRTIKVGNQGVRPHTWLVEEQVVDIVRSFNLEDPYQHRDFVVFRTTVMLGMRRAEVASLRWENFRRDLAEVQFVGKGSKLATLPIPGQLRLELDRWRRTQPAGAVPYPSFRWKITASGTPELGARWDDPLGPDGIYQIVKRIANAHGVTSLAPHDLRRSFAGIMESKGVALRDLQALMRHEQLSTTDRYMEKNPGRLARAIEGVTWES